MADLAWDDEAQEYVSLYEVTVEGGGTTGVGYQEFQNESLFRLGQNLPNPVVHRPPSPSIESAGASHVVVVVASRTLRAQTRHGHVGGRGTQVDG